MMDDEDQSTSTPSAAYYTDDYSDNTVPDDNGSFWRGFWEDHNRTLTPDNASDLFYRDPFPPHSPGTGDAHSAASPGFNATLQCSLCWMMVGLWACCLVLLFRRLLPPPLS
ncbi:hypothetical protein ACOMHN_057157 [Nucella lapillus]